MAATSALEQTQTLNLEFRRLTSEAGELARSLTRIEWNRRAEEGAWSVAEILEHLSLTTAALLPRLEEARRQVPPARGRPFKAGWKERLLIWYLNPPYQHRTRTRPPFEPGIMGATEEALPRFSDCQAQIEFCLQSPAGLALDRAYVVSPFNANLVYSAWAALLILAAYQRRHLWQAARVRERIRALARP